MRSNFLMMAVVSAGLMVAVEASPQAPKRSRPATIGEFAVQVSTALGYEDPTPEAAARNLRGHGADLGADFSASLTEGMAARVMADLGYSVVKPADPSTPVSQTRAGFLAGTIATEGLPGNVSPEGFGLNDSLPPILQCLHSPNSAVCTQCCFALLPPRFPSGLGQRICTRICAFNAPPPSLTVPGS